MPNTITEDDYTAQRATASDVTVSIGPMWATQINLVSQRKSTDEDSKFPYACPGEGHEAVSRVKQFFQCPEGHLHPQADLLRAREAEDGTLVLASKDEIGQLKTGGLERNVIELRVHPADEVEHACRPDGLAYRARPGKKAPRKSYAVLKALAEREDLALIGWLRLKDSRRLYRLTCWNDQIVLQSLIGADDMQGVDQIALPDLDGDEIGRVVAAVESTAEPFTPEDYRFDVAAAVASFVEERAKDPQAKPIPVTTGVSEDADVISLLEKSLAGSKLGKAKAAKKAAPRKKAAA